MAEEAWGKLSVCSTLSSISVTHFLTLILLNNLSRDKQSATMPFSRQLSVSSYHEKSPFVSS